MPYFISRDGSYHEGDQQPGDIPCGPRTDIYATWDGHQWNPEPSAATAARIDAESLSDLQRDKLVRLLIDILYDHDARLRVQEIKTAITKQQYKTALLSAYKALP
jgi:hypothetical protein